MRSVQGLRARGSTIRIVRERERDILERAVAAVAEQAAKADALIDYLRDAGMPEDGAILLAKLIRRELLIVKGDLERELGVWVLDCRRCNRRVHWVAGLGITPGHWAHAEPAPAHDIVLFER